MAFEENERVFHSYRWREAPELGHGRDETGAVGMPLLRGWFFRLRVRSRISRGVSAHLFSRVDTHGGMVRLRRRLALTVKNHRDEPVTLYRQQPNQLMKPTAPFRHTSSVFATTPCRGLSLSR
jgi:hypothetical protein